MPASVKKWIPDEGSREVRTHDVRVMDELLTNSFLHKLQVLSRTMATEYRSNEPYPHVVIDEFLPSAVAEAALAGFPEPNQADWHAYTDVNQRRKLSFDVVEKLPEPLRDVLQFLNGRPMLQFLEALTGISGLLTDPGFVGGGLHQIKPGGLVEVHADFSYHNALRLDRRINVLIYLNKDWKPEYGGHFELWDRKVTQAQKKILPVFNRCVIFNTTSESFHGHPEPLACPPDRNRKSLATFYYSNGRPEEDPQLTLRHPVAFQERPGINRVKLTIRAKNAVRALTPPIVTDWVRRMRG